MLVCRLGRLNLNVLLVDGLLDAHILEDDVLLVDHRGRQDALLRDFHVFGLRACVQGHDLTLQALLFGLLVVLQRVVASELP